MNNQVYRLDAYEFSRQTDDAMEEVNEAVARFEDGKFGLAYDALRNAMEHLRAAQQRIVIPSEEVPA